MGPPDQQSVTNLNCVHHKFTQNVFVVLVIAAMHGVQYGENRPLTEVRMGVCPLAASYKEQLALLSGHASDPQPQVRSHTSCTNFPVSGYQRQGSLRRLAQFSSVQFSFFQFSRYTWQV